MPVAHAHDPPAPLATSPPPDCPAPLRDALTLLASPGATFGERKEALSLVEETLDTLPSASLARLAPTFEAALLVQTLETTRSSLVRNTCAIVTALSGRLGPAFGPTAGSLLPHLLAGTASEVPTCAEAAHQCLAPLLALGTIAPPPLAPLTAALRSAPLPARRARLVSYLAAVVSAHSCPPEALGMVLTPGDLRAAQEALGSCADDPGTGEATREAARAAMRAVAAALLDEEVGQGWGTPSGGDGRNGRLAGSPPPPGGPERERETRQGPCRRRLRHAAPATCSRGRSRGCAPLARLPLALPLARGGGSKGGCLARCQPVGRKRVPPLP